MNNLPTTKPLTRGARRRALQKQRKQTYKKLNNPNSGNEAVSVQTNDVVTVSKSKLQDTDFPNLVNNFDDIVEDVFRFVDLRLRGYYFHVIQGSEEGSCDLRFTHYDDSDRYLKEDELPHFHGIDVEEVSSEILLCGIYPAMMKFKLSEDEGFYLFDLFEKDDRIFLLSALRSFVERIKKKEEEELKKVCVCSSPLVVEEVDGLKMTEDEKQEFEARLSAERFEEVVDRACDPTTLMVPENLSTDEKQQTLTEFLKENERLMPIVSDDENETQDSSDDDDGVVVRVEASTVTESVNDSIEEREKACIVLQDDNDPVNSSSKDHDETPVVPSQANLMDDGIVEGLQPSGFLKHDFDLFDLSFLFSEQEDNRCLNGSIGPLEKIKDCGGNEVFKNTKLDSAMGDTHVDRVSEEKNKAKTSEVLSREFLPIAPKMRHSVSEQVRGRFSDLNLAPDKNFPLFVNEVFHNDGEKQLTGEKPSVRFVNRQSDRLEVDIPDGGGGTSIVLGKRSASRTDVHTSDHISNEGNSRKKKSFSEDMIHVIDFSFEVNSKPLEEVSLVREEAAKVTSKIRSETRRRELRKVSRDEILRAFGRNDDSIIRYIFHPVKMCYLYAVSKRLGALVYYISELIHGGCASFSGEGSIVICQVNDYIYDEFAVIKRSMSTSFECFLDTLSSMNTRNRDIFIAEIPKSFLRKIARSVARVPKEYWCIFDTCNMFTMQKIEMMKSIFRLQQFSTRIQPFSLCDDDCVMLHIGATVESSRYTFAATEGLLMLKEYYDVPR